jgi:hypothetical protein
MSKPPTCIWSALRANHPGALFRFLVGAFGFVDGYRWSFVTNGGAR